MRLVEISSKMGAPCFLPFLLVLGFSSGIMGVQQFRDEPKYTEVNPGADATLTCKVENIGGECRWQKDGKPIGLYPGKYQFSGKPNLGDCSLRVLNANITFDDGVWQCQVTSSSFVSQDSLSSTPKRLVVREPPQTYAIIQNKNSMDSGTLITVVDGQSETLHCESRQSNPPARLRWYLGDSELVASEKRNDTEENDERRWKTFSALQHVFSKEDFGKTLTCKIEHPAYPTGFQETSVNLDVLHKPIVKVRRVADDVLEENLGKILLTCESEANPPARVFWRKSGGGKAAPRQYTESLEFKPVTRQDSGTYICQAENSIGVSNEERTEIDVLFPPKILRVTPRSGAIVAFRNRTILTCSAEGNPLPKYQWLQKLPSQQVMKRAYEDNYVIEDVSYDHQGDYVCEAINVIGGQRKIVQSDPVNIEVRGAPQVLRYSADKVEAISGRDVRLEMEVCSDPIPSRMTWDWGSKRVDAGQELHGKYLAEKIVEHPERKDCYVARLLVKKVSPLDSKRYYLDVENAHGTDRYAVALMVKDPVSMSSVIGVVIALLVVFVLMVIFLLYAYKRQKMCFKDGSKLDKNNLHGNHTGFDAEKPATIGTAGRSNSSYSNGAVNGANGHGPLPPDGMYHVTDMTNNGSLLDPNGSLADKVSNPNSSPEPVSTSSSQANIIANVKGSNGGGQGQGHFYTNPASVHPHSSGVAAPNPPARMRLPSSTCV